MDRSSWASSSLPGCFLSSTLKASGWVNTKTWQSGCVAVRTSVLLFHFLLWKSATEASTFVRQQNVEKRVATWNTQNSYLIGDPFSINWFFRYLSNSGEKNRFRVTNLGWKSIEFPSISTPRHLLVHHKIHQRKKCNISGALRVVNFEKKNISIESAMFEFFEICVQCSLTTFRQI